MVIETGNARIQRATDDIIVKCFRRRGTFSEETGLSLREMAETHEWTLNKNLRMRVSRLVEEGRLLSNKNEAVRSDQICYWLPVPSQETEE